MKVSVNSLLQTVNKYIESELGSYLKTRIDETDRNLFETLIAIKTIDLN